MYYCDRFLVTYMFILLPNPVLFGALFSLTNRRRDITVIVEKTRYDWLMHVDVDIDWNKKNQRCQIAIDGLPAPREMDFFFKKKNYTMRL